MVLRRVLCLLSLLLSIACVCVMAEEAESTVLSPPVRTDPAVSSSCPPGGAADSGCTVESTEVHTSGGVGGTGASGGIVGTKVVVKEEDPGDGDKSLGKSKVDHEVESVQELTGSPGGLQQNMQATMNQEKGPLLPQPSAKQLSPEREKGPAGTQVPPQSPSVAISAPSSPQASNSLQPSTTEVVDGVSSLESKNEKSDNGDGEGAAVSQAQQQVAERSGAETQPGSTSDNQQNAVDSRTSQNSNAQSVVHESENAQSTTNENGSEGTQDAGSNNTAQSKESTDTQSEPENATTPNNKESTTTTTTTTTTTLPPEPTNNKKGDADSSS
ncbi:uncharacterized protein TM35_000771000, partial [Trypanosoma theileri]